MYCMCIMFHLMMAWIFSRRSLPLSKRLIGALMLLVCLQYIKDLPLVSSFMQTIVSTTVCQRVSI